MQETLVIYSILMLKIVVCLEKLKQIMFLGIKVLNILNFLEYNFKQFSTYRWGYG